MGNYYGGRYIETRLGETKKGERTTIFVETHLQKYHTRAAIIGYEWRVASGYSTDGMVEMRVYGSVGHEGLEPLIVAVDGHVLSLEEQRHGIDDKKIWKHLSPTQFAEVRAALATPGDFVLFWPLIDHPVSTDDSPTRRFMGIAETIFGLIDSAAGMFLRRNPDWKPPEGPNRSWEN